MVRKTLITEYLEKPLLTYIQEESCARRGRCRSYLDTAARLGIPRDEIEKAKIYRPEPQLQLTRSEIEQFVLGNTLRRPCFDLLFFPDGRAKCSWIDSLDDTRESLALDIRKRLGLTFKPDESYGVPVYQVGRWYWGEDGVSIIRDFGTCYDKPFKTEFFFQPNGLLSVKSHNMNQTIWYDLLVFNSDQVLDYYGVSWSEIEAFTDVRSNNMREIEANAVPQHRNDQRQVG